MATLSDVTSGELDAIKEVLAELKSQSLRLAKMQATSFQWQSQHHSNLKKIALAINQISSALEESGGPSIRRVELDEDAHLLASDAAAPRRAPETPTAAGAAAVVVSDMGGEINAVLRGLLASHQDEALVQLLQRTPPDIVQGITPDTWLKLVPLALQQWMAIPETVQPSPLRSMAYLICAHLAHNLPQLWGRPELQGAAAQVRRQCVELQRRGVALEVTTLSGDEIAALIQALAKWAW